MNDKGAGFPESRKLLSTLYPDYNGAAQELRLMDWPNQPYTLGGYSFPRRKQITVVGERLYNGLPWLQIAGEHSCYKFAGFMEGALQSGQRAANNIAKQYGRSIS